MKLSFIIPCYNGADTLRFSVESVIKQGIEDYEIIIINDGSTDNTLKEANRIKSECPNVIVLDKSNGGVSSARNLGIKHSSGDYLVFLDADDEFDSDFWKEVKQYTDRSKSLIIFGFDFEELPTKTRLYKNKIKGDIIADYLMGRVHIHICSIITKREIIINNNILFDEGTHFSEDIEFIVKVLMASKEYIYIHKNLFHYKYRESSAMHINAYNQRKSTSLDAMSRVYDMVDGNKIRRNAALTHLNLSIILHVRKYLRTKCQDGNIWNKLQNYCSKYLTIKTSLGLNNYSIYVWIMSRLYRLDKSLFYKVLKSI